MSTSKPKPKLSYKAQSFPSSEKPFECTACQLYFRRLHDLKRHERLHTGERPYRCNNCCRTFARLDALKRHLSAESNVNCSDWTYQPGLVSGFNRPAMRLHQRSISLPYVQSAAIQASSFGPLDNTEQTHIMPSSKEHGSFPPHYQHRQLQSSSEPHILKRVEGDQSLRQDELRYPSRSSTDPEHHCCQDRLYWSAQTKGSLPRLNNDKPLKSDMVMEDVSLDRLSPAPQLCPQSNHHRQSLPHSHTLLEPHPQQYLPLFSKDQQRYRCKSYPSSPSRSSLSPSPSPVLSPSSSLMSTSSMPSLTNMWSHSRAPDAFGTSTPRREDRYHYENLKPRSGSFSFSQQSARQELSPFSGEGSGCDRRHSREFERRPGLSLTSILKSPVPHSNSYLSIDQTPPPQPTSSQSQYFHHAHSHSYPHLQQYDHHHHHHSRQHTHDNEHCCDAMVEIQKLRQELQWVTMQYRTFCEKTRTESISRSSRSSSNSSGGGSGDNGGGGGGGGGGSSMVTVT